MSSMIRMKCKCGMVYEARKADIDRGWGRSCSKSCAAVKRNRKTGQYKKHLRSINREDLGEEVGHVFAPGFWGHGQD